MTGVLRESPSSCRREFYKSLFKRERDHVKRTHFVRVSAFACARAHRGCGSIIQSAVVVQRGGKVAYSFVATNARCIASFARGEKFAAAAQWPSQWSRQVVYGAGAENGCRVYQPARKNPRCSPPVACTLCLPVDLSMRSTLPIYDGH